MLRRKEMMKATRATYLNNIIYRTNDYLNKLKLSQSYVALKRNRAAHKKQLVLLP